MQNLRRHWWPDLAKNHLAEGYTQNRAAGLDAAATAINLSPVLGKQSKYVANICVGVAGVIGAACTPYASDGVYLSS